MRYWGLLGWFQPPGPVTFSLFIPIPDHRPGVLATIRSPVVGIPAAPLAVGLKIVVPVIRVGGSPCLLPAAFAFPLTFGGRTELLLGRLRAGVKEFVAGGTTSLFHT
jgi:hypothetical protein